MKYRTRSEILTTILQAASGPAGATKTSIMYSAYVSYSQAKEYIRSLRSKELVWFDPATAVYRLTEGGQHLLRVLDEISDMMVITDDDAQSSIEAAIAEQRNARAPWPRDR